MADEINEILDAYNANTLKEIADAAGMDITKNGKRLPKAQLISKLQKEYGPQGLQVVAVAADDMAAKMVGPLTRLRQPGFPLGAVDQETAMKLCDFKRDDHPFVPMYLFVDKKGTVRVQYAGKDDFFKAEEKNTRILIEAPLKQ